MDMTLVYLQWSLLLLLIWGARVPIASHPSGYVDAVWRLEELSGSKFAGVPLEELLFALTLGAAWSGFYEHTFWQGRVDRGNKI